MEFYYMKNVSINIAYISIINIIIIRASKYKKAFTTFM